MTKQIKQMKLGAFFMIPGHHVASWRHKEANTDGIFNFDFLKELALTAERGKFDALFVADGYSYEHNGKDSQRVGISFEPFTLLSAVSAVTSKIGLIGTVSTTYNEPFNVARKFGSLDLLSKGRAGWNVVTSGRDSEAQNFNLDQHLLHHNRYERAEEFVDVVTKLWDSWEDDAIVANKQLGIYAEGNKIHPINHEGQWFKVKGPLNIPRSPQGQPVVVQAGSSDDGKELAARTAEVIFTAWQTLEEAQAFYKDVKGRLSKYGRQEDELKIMPGVFPIIGDTEEEALQRKQYFDSLIPEELGIQYISSFLSIDLSGLSIDDPIPQLPEVDSINGGKSRFQLLKDLITRENLTIRQLYTRIAGARGHREIVGTPEQIADQLELWIQNRAADGFNIMPPYLPGGLDEFVDKVIPILQQRGLFRYEYEGDTLREHLGLEKPINQYKNTLATTTI
ncbi:LLM class flavin-dependent oxidoreductase [Paenibacillus endoradicis]|uniref:LLM class flavin-dependent oxidoreductase n=1 Tax=Paenibacillus endoradicis TaxID=2972487 RepID=UPI00215947AC|nr:LLM class flavin-dependent oxidoreductase [Paenibacillus endoradicis]MCR8657155.1 LLM class flavin-dependent oxidoreductase [Paenibacillus endoradicis]